MSARNKADSEWERYKARIESLYVEDNLKLEGTGGLIDTMESTYGFSKKKSQYESQFRIWGMRKYRKKDDWKSIGRNILERKRAGKDSDVYINGDIISSSKIQKETRRHGFVTVWERNRPAPIPPIPNGFEIRTPAAEEVVPLTAHSGKTPSFPVETETQGCASSQLQSVSSAMPSQTVTSDASLSVLRNAMSPSPSMVTTDLSPTQSQNATPSPPCVPGMYGSPPFVFEEVDKILQSWNYTYDLPFCQFEDGLHAQFETSLISTNAQSFGSEMILETILLPVHYHNIFNKDIDVLHEVLKGSETFTAVLKALLPSARVSQAENQMILSPNHHRSYSASSKLFTLLVFAMANNFADLNNVPIGEILKYLEDQTSNRLLQHVLSVPGPESEAFAEKLFLAAVKMEDARIVKTLLQKGLIPNDLVCVHRGEKYTPLEYSSMVWNVEITRLLLNANLDVNKSFAGGIDSGGAFYHAIGGQWSRSEHARGSIPFELVHMLLDAGSKFSWSRSGAWTSQVNQEVLDLLVDNTFKTKTYEEAWHQFDSLMRTSQCDDATATRTYARLLKGCVNRDHVSFALALDTAAERGNLELVKLLLRSRVSSTMETLTRAIRSKNKELIRLLLDDGADVSACEERATEHCYEVFEIFSPVPSPLSEAIRWGDAEILDLLEAKGAWSRIVNKGTTQGEFEDVLIAASVRGQITIVQKLLHYRPPNTYGKDLSDALVAAIYSNEDAIVLTLLDAGANVNGGFFQASDLEAAVREGFDSASSIDAGTEMDSCERYQRGPALVEALLQKNEHLVRLILDADVYFDGSHSSRRGLSLKTPLEAAVEWGNLSIIKEVISLGVHNEFGALRISVRKKNLECTQLMVNAGVRISSEVLEIAVTNNDIEMVEYLISVGANTAITGALFAAEALPNGLPIIERLLTEFARRRGDGYLEYGSVIFQKAIQEGKFALINLLLDAKMILDCEDQIPHSDEEGLYFMDSRWPPSRVTLLWEAIVQRHTTSLKILQRLLKEVGTPNIVVHTSTVYPYRIRETALLVAIDRKDIPKVWLLIDAGASVNWPATKGVKRTPLQKAAEIGSFEITQLLISKGGLVNNEPAVRGGATALQLAAIGGYIGIAELLLENGADVNAPSAKFYGRTALEGAAEHGRIDMLKLLCNAGAEFHGGEYEKARELAKGNGHMATRRYLESLYGAREGNSMDT